MTREGTYSISILRSQSGWHQLVKLHFLFSQGGVLTPAAGLGSAFIDRIIATGIKFEILETDSQKSSQKAAQKLA